MGLNISHGSLSVKSINKNISLYFLFFFQIEEHNERTNERKANKQRNNKAIKAGNKGNKQISTILYKSLQGSHIFARDTWIYNGPLILKNDVFPINRYSPKVIDHLDN